MSEPVYVSELKDHGLSVRAHNCLCRENIWTIDQLTLRSADDLREIRAIGVGTVRNIENALQAVGRELRQDDPRASMPEFLWTECGVALCLTEQGTGHDRLRMDFWPGPHMRSQPDTLAGRFAMAEDVAQVIKSLSSLYQFLLERKVDGS